MILNLAQYSLTDSIEWIEIQQKSEDKALPRIRMGKLPIKNVHVNTDVFQCRNSDNFGEAARLSSQQLKELRKQLKLGDLDPIIIYPAGGEYFLIDGHHRYEAYKLGGAAQIPVKVFKGTPEEALLYSIKENSKTKLSLSQEQKLDLAWGFVATNGYELSAKKIAHLYSVGETTIKIMRKRKKEIEGELPDNWWQAREDRTLSDKPDWREKKIEKMSQGLYKLIGVELTKDPDIVTEALARLGEYRNTALLDSLIMSNKRNFHSPHSDIDDGIDTKDLFLDNILKGLEGGRDRRPNIYKIEEEAIDSGVNPYS